jgi:hypothetical protein
MGIERFFSSINRNFNVVDVLNFNQKIECNTLLIDFNSIIHNVSSKLSKKLNKKEYVIDKEFTLSDIEEIKDFKDTPNVHVQAETHASKPRCLQSIQRFKLQRFRTFITFPNVLTFWLYSTMSWLYT